MSKDLMDDEPENSKGESSTVLLHRIRNSHSKALENHQTILPVVVPVRSSLTLRVRGPSYPALPPDSSYESVRETHSRRSIHRQALSADRKTFFRKLLKESPSEFLHQKQTVMHLFAGLHEEHDNSDLAILSGAKKRHSESRLKSRPSSTQFFSMPAQDFLVPGDPIEYRTTGFSAGHVRSMMHLDTYGPKDSIETEIKRAEGIIPKSPNLNKNLLLLSSPERNLLTSVGVRNDSPQSLVVKERLSTKKLHDMQREASYILKDPRSRRMHWFDSYQSREKFKSMKRLEVVKSKFLTDSKMRETEEEKKNLELFEYNLRSMSKFGR